MKMHAMEAAVQFSPLCAVLAQTQQGLLDSMLPALTGGLVTNFWAFFFNSIVM